ncbi:hypothetical protein [Haliscomenobacter sp.]|uniref:hypothetical protein n=1 Tax=Haliscomenobacter sp. TaxID=2717303 RepID=UPI003BAD3088
MTHEIEIIKYDAETALGSIKSNLDQYATKANANQAYYQDKVNQLVAIRRYILALEALLPLLEAERENAFKNGYQQGYQAAQVDNSGHTSFSKQRHYDREGARYDRIAASRRTWPELY